jgi:hypothetical protein
MKPKRSRRFEFLVPLGRIAVFYVPAEKMDDPQFDVPLPGGAGLGSFWINRRDSICSNPLPG